MVEADEAAVPGEVEPEPQPSPLEADEREAKSRRTELNGSYLRHPARAKSVMALALRADMQQTLWAG